VFSVNLQTLSNAISTAFFCFTFTEISAVRDGDVVASIPESNGCSRINGHFLFREYLRHYSSDQAVRFVIRFVVNFSTVPLLAEFYRVKDD
jgi:hypothetical protein